MGEQPLLEGSSGEPNDDRLLEAARQGDKQALARLLALVQPQIYRFGMRMCRHPGDAEDVLQETLLTIARKLQDFKATSSLSTWAYTVARSHCIKQRRRKKSAPPQHDSLDSLGSEPASRGSNQFDQLANKEAWAQVAEAIAGLDPTYKEVLILRDVEGLGAAQVAEIVGVSVPALKSRLHRARHALRAALGPSEPGEECPDLVEMFSRHLEGELTAQTCQVMEAHIQECPRCEGLCKALQEDLRVCKSAPDSEIPKAVRQRIEGVLARLS